MTTLEVLKDILKSNLAIDPDTLSRESNLEALNVDSLAMIEVLFAVEDAFAITIPSESVSWREKMVTMGDLVDYVDGIVSTQRATTAQKEMA
jgi:acyl carrier protein